MKYFLLAFVCVILSCKPQVTNPDDCNLIGIGAHKVDNRLHIINNSGHTISPGIGLQFPDTSLNRTVDCSMLGNPDDKADPGKTYIFGFNTCWEYEFKNNIPSHKLQLYIFDAEMINKLPWDTIIARNLFLKRYVFTYDSLQSLHWKVNFP